MQQIYATLFLKKVRITRQMKSELGEKLLELWERESTEFQGN